MGDLRVAHLARVLRILRSTTACRMELKMIPLARWWHCQWSRKQRSAAPRGAVLIQGALVSPLAWGEDPRKAGRMWNREARVDERPGEHSA